MRVRANELDALRAPSNAPQLPSHMSRQRAHPVPHDLVISPKPPPRLVRDLTYPRARTNENGKITQPRRSIPWTRNTNTNANHERKEHTPHYDTPQRSKAGW